MPHLSADALLSDQKGLEFLSGVLDVPEADRVPRFGFEAASVRSVGDMSPLDARNEGMSGDHKDLIAEPA